MGPWTVKWRNPLFLKSLSSEYFFTDMEQWEKEPRQWVFTEPSKSFKRRSILFVSFNTYNNLCMQNLLVGTSSGPDGLRCCIFRAITVYLISILEHLMQRFTVFKSLWNCENIKRCGRGGKKQPRKKKEEENEHFLHTCSQLGSQLPDSYHLGAPN